MFEGQESFETLRESVRRCEEEIAKCHDKIVKSAAYSQGFILLHTEDISGAVP